MKEELIKSNYKSLIFEFRGIKVMIDADLSALYEIETKALKQQVKRNKIRFPEDFMFELTSDEKLLLVTKCDRLSGLKHSSVNPMAFTEQGVAMLSSVLKSDRAALINIEIMRAFVKYRILLDETKEIKQQISAIDDKVNQVFQFLVDEIEKLKPAILDKNRKLIGYKTSGSDTKKK